MSDIHIDSMSIFDEVEEHPDCTVQILKNSVTGEVSIGWTENQRGECGWCGGRSVEWSVIDEDFGQYVHPNFIRYCFHCGRKLKEGDDENA